MMKKFTISWILFLLFFSTISQAQTVYRSRQNGNWGDFTTWDRSTDGGASYTAAASGQLPTTNTSVIVQAPNTVTIEASGKNCVNLTIQSGAKLTSGANAFALRVGAGSSGSTNIVGTLQNDGTFGGPGDLTVLELPITCSQLTVTGSGTNEIGRIRAITGNTNYPSGTIVGHANDAKLIINSLIKLNTANNYEYSIANSSVSANDVITFTVNAGKTLTFSAPDAYMHNNSTGSNGGVYTYNVDGTIDLSATTTGNTTFGAYMNAGSSLNLNVSGLMKLGTLFSTTSNGGQAGAVNLVIKNGGVVDATNTTFNIDPKYPFVIEGTGKINRTVGATDAVFPVAVAGSFNAVTINNTGTADVFSVNVKNTFDVTAPAAKRVNRQWTINEAVAGGSNATLKFSWTTADQTAGFSTTAPVFVYHYNGTGWDALPATVSGSGTTVDPYVATVNGVTSFSPFAVGNSPILPVSFMSTKAYSKGTGVQVEWTTAMEEGITGFAIERSTDGRSFLQVGVVTAANRSSAYTWFDAAPLTGTNYYRIKSIEGGSGKYTAIMKVSVGKGAASFVIASNPVRNGSFTVQLSGLEKGAYALRLYNNAGQQVATQALAVEGSSLSQTIALPSLPKGSYTVQLSNSKTAMTQKIIIE